MAERDKDLQNFLDAAAEAYRGRVKDEQSRGAVSRIFAALERQGVPAQNRGARLPVCDRLSSIVKSATTDSLLRRLLDSFERLEPRLQWRPRAHHDGSASANFAENHANAMVAGPTGFEERQDVWLGVTLMAPHVRYPDHDHAPEEVYLVLSPGEFKQGEGDWFSPGIGGSFYNRPGIRHAMRSVDAPFLAFWALSAEGAG